MGTPSINGPFSMVMLNNQMVIIIIMNDNVHVHVPSFSHISSARCWKMIRFYSMENI